MKNCLKLLAILATVILSSCNSQAQQAKKDGSTDTLTKVNLTEAQWKAKLTPEQYYVLRQKGTDQPFSNKYWLHHDKGVYSCAACGQELFTSDMKFDTDCGWPGFDRELAGGRVRQIEDNSFGMHRVEIVCAKCGSHLGHLFEDGPTLTGMRYCVNSTSIGFKPTMEKVAKKGKN